MIIDVHTHIGTSAHIGEQLQDDLDCCWAGLRWNVDLEDHRSAMAGVDAAVVLAFDAPFSGIEVPNEYVAQYVATDSRFIGFSSVDPNRPDAIERLQHATHDLGLRGLKLGPIYQNFDLNGPAAMRLLALAERLGLPVMCHQGTTFVRRARLALALPRLLDDVAIAFPDLRIVIAHLGHPWFAETMAVIRKHRHVYADVSAVAHRPYQLYTALLTATEYGVQDKLLFGSDFPFGTPHGMQEALLAVTEMAAGTNFPAVSERSVAGIIQRDALGVLGIS